MGFQDLEVVVKDKFGVPLISFVEVVIFSFPIQWKASGETKETGSIKWENLPADHGTIEVRKRGYKAQKKDIKIGWSGVQVVNFELRVNDDPDADPDETDDTLSEKLSNWINENKTAIILVLVFIIILGIMALAYIKGYWQIGLLFGKLKEVI